MERISTAYMRSLSACVFYGYKEEEGIPECQRLTLLLRFAHLNQSKSR